MPRHRHRKPSTRRKSDRALWLVLLGVLAIVLGYDWRRPYPAGRELSARAAVGQKDVAVIAGIQTPSPAEPGRLVYPYSVVRGGIHSAAELQNAITSDPIVRKHYGGFRVTHARIVRLRNSRFA